MNTNSYSSLHMGTDSLEQHATAGTLSASHNDAQVLAPSHIGLLGLALIGTYGVMKSRHAFDAVGVEAGRVVSDMLGSLRSGAPDPRKYVRYDETNWTPFRNSVF